MLYLLQSQASKITTDVECTHAIRMRENTSFYRDWLLPKFRDFIHYKKWPQPTIASLLEDGISPANYVPSYQDDIVLHMSGMKMSALEETFTTTCTTTSTTVTNTHQADYKA